MSKKSKHRHRTPRTYDVVRKPFDATAPRYSMPEAHRAVAALPVRQDLTPLLFPVYDQGQLGSCTGNGWAAVFEWDLRLNKLPIWTPSRLFIYYGERALDGDIPDDAGASVADGGSVVTKLGAPKETTWPYDISKFAVKPSDAAYAEARNHIVRSVETLDNTIITELKSALVDYHPVVFGFDVYESFESNAVAQSGLVPMPAKGEQLLGGHCVVLVGYDDNFAFPASFKLPKGAFIVRNSWGSSWGQKGYCKMPYAYVTSSVHSSDFWVARGISG